MISMLAGDVFRDGGVRWRLRFFKLLYLITSLGRAGAIPRELLEAPAAGCDDIRGRHHEAGRCVRAVTNV